MQDKSAEFSLLSNAVHITTLFPALYFAYKMYYTMMQSDRNSSKTDTFYKPTTYEPHVYTSFDQMITFARHEYGRVGVFRIKIRSLVQKL